jgi:hypothetical protein
VQGVLVVHAGNRIDGPDRTRPRFPAANEAVVAQGLGDVLDRIAPDGVVTAGAAGADLLMAHEALKRRIALHLHLPCPRSQFREASVVDQGERWASMFDRVVERVTSDDQHVLVELDLEPDLEGFLAGNEALIDYANRTARTGLVAVAVRHVDSHQPATVTDDFVRRAERAGLQVVEIDPMAGMGDCRDA